MVTSIKYSPEDDAKNDFLLVGPFVPIRTNWLQTKFFVLNFSKQSLNISSLCKNCLFDRFILIKILHWLTWKPAAWASQKGPLKGHRVTGYRNWSQYVFGNADSFFRFLLEMSESSPKRLFKIARCFRSHLVSLFESF